MIQKMDVPVTVTLRFDSVKRQVVPEVVVWNGHTHEIKKIGFHHTYKEGQTLFHVFSVVSETLFFKLVLNTQNLHWRLEEIADGEAD